MLLASTNPAAVSYDPAFCFELGHIVQDALRRMYGDKPENIFYYLTVYNEPYLQPAEPEDVDVEGILRGHPPLLPRRRGRRAEGAAARLRRRGAVGAGGAAPAAGRLERAGRRVVGDLLERAASRRPRRRRAQLPAPRRTSCGCPTSPEALDGAPGPFVAVSDFMRAVQDQIAPWVPGDFASLGTDGFGLSDTRGALRRHFKVDAASITVRTLSELARRGEVKRRERARGDRALPARPTSTPPRPPRPRAAPSSRPPAVDHVRYAGARGARWARLVPGALAWCGVRRWGVLA